eukprot:GILJ01007595.1.p1 GENE.GILJ01007595.1~~GILJ01007595.1.p1  ORF type:complete len:291 (-),score=37.82 GILJ01007595.1:324-1166(-)
MRKSALPVAGLRENLHSAPVSSGAATARETSSTSARPAIPSRALSAGVKRAPQASAGSRAVASTRSSRDSPALQEERKEDKPKGFTNKPSARFDPHKAADPFSSKAKHKTNFGYIYSKGGIPCRINHGSVVNRLQWDRNPTEIDYNPLLVHCFEGLAETEHPFVFVARQAVKELLESEGAYEKTCPLLSQLVPHIRTCLMSKSKEIFDAGLESITQLSNLLGPSFNDCLGVLLLPMNKRIFDRASKEKIMDILQKLEENGGRPALLIIKSKVPTYQTMNG